MSQWDIGRVDRAVELGRRASKVGMKLFRNRHSWSLFEDGCKPITCRTLDHVESVLDIRERAAPA